MGPNKYVHLTFAVAGLLVAFLLAKAGDWVWSYFAKPNELALNAGALLCAVLALVAAYRSERVFNGVVEITRELERVTWPSRKETSASTVVVLVTVVVAAGILSAFDAIWSLFIRKLLG